MNDIEKKYVLGLDLGISSVGWALMIKDNEDNYRRIENLGVRIFPILEDKSGKLENEKRREKRSQRRMRRRKQLRLEDARNLFLSYLNVEFEKLVFKDYRNPYELKIAGLTTKLAKEELAIALYHYIKYRGFQSNRKVEDKKSEGELLNQLSFIENELEETGKTITEYFYSQYLALDPASRRIHNVDQNSSLYNKKDPNKTIRNKDDRYIFAANRSMYLKEISLLLEKQLSFGLINQEFIDEFIKLFTRQRSFSLGPGRGSPYAAPEGMSLISKMIGVCSFDKLPRAPKAAFSSESFVFLSFLNNLQFKEKQESNYRSLTKEEINAIYNFALEKDKLTYTNMFKAIGLEVYRIKGHDLSRKQFITLMKKYKDENKITDTLNATQYEEFSLYSRQKLLDQEVRSLSNYHEQKKAFINYAKNNISTKKEIEAFIKVDTNFDIISEILLHNKVDTEIEKACQKNGFSKAITSVIVSLPSVEKVINLSLDLCRKLIPLLKEGKRYDQAMTELGYQHSVTASNIEKHELLPEINECVAMLDESLTNANVRHTLVEMRRVVNAVIKKYGFIHEFNIEFARDLARTFEDRAKIKNMQKDNLIENMQLKQDLILKFPNFFKKHSDIKGDTLLKYQLYKEQNGKCAYSNKPISINEVFDSTATQIDHIMPYSRTFENRNFNKVLVFTSYNQEKKNKLPYEAFKGEKWQNIIDFINDPNVRISDKKKETLLLKEINDEEWLERNKNDTRYACVLAKKIIESFLKPNRCRAVAGGITAKVKTSYGLINLTHSFINQEYKRYETFKIIKASFKVNGISFLLKDNHNNEHTCDILIKKAVGKNPLSYNDSELNEALNYILSNPSFLEKYLEDNDLDIDKLLEATVDKLNASNDINQSTLYEFLVRIITEIKQETIEIANIKDRSNHLHHILDAAVIAITDDKMIFRIQNFEKLKETKFDEETGEQITSARFGLPYPEFRKEVILRIYERNYDVLIKKLRELDNYKTYNFDSNNCYVTYPSRSPNKNISGPFTKETILGYNKKLNVITKRVSVNSINEKNIDSILNVSGGSNAQIEAIKEWLKNDKPTQFPVLPQKGTYIKKVTLIESTDVRKRVQIRANAFAENDTVIRVDVYRKKIDDGLIYFVPVYYYQIEQEKLLLKGYNVRNVLYEMMWRPGEDNREFLTQTQLIKDFNKLLSLPRYSLIELSFKNGNSGLCYSGGLTSGLFEIYTILGDDQDLLNYNIITKISDRYRPSVSTINNIKLRSISILGKIS